MDALRDCFGNKEDCAEKMYLMGMGIPEELVVSYQQKRTEWGIYPTATQRVILNIIIGLIVVVLMMAFVSFLLNYLYFLKRGLTANLWTKGELIGLSLTTGFIIALALWSFNYYWKLDDKGYDFLKDVFFLEGFQNGNPKLFANSGPEMNLANLQFVATKHTGFIGPKEAGGSFKPEPAILASLRLGIRAFVLQIDTMEAKKAGFAAPGEPTLVVRDARGTLLSKNDAKLGEVAALLNTYAFNEEVRSSDQPLVLYLHFVRAPSAIRKPEDYVAYLSKVATALEPLVGRNLSSVPEGAAFARQQGEPQLLKTALKTFGQKVIVACNADTSIYRNLERLGQKPMEPKADLDYLTHLRVYADTEKDRVGNVMEVAPQGKRAASAVFVKAGRILAMKENELDDFAKRGKERLVIAMPAGFANPSKPDIRKLLDLAGVNMLPLGLYGEEVAALRGKLSAWGEEPFLRLKPAAMQVAPLQQAAPAGAQQPPAAA